MTLGGLLDEGGSPERLWCDESLGTFSSPPILQRGAGDGVNDGPCECDETSITNPTNPDQDG